MCFVWCSDSPCNSVHFLYFHQCRNAWQVNILPTWKGPFALRCLGKPIGVQIVAVGIAGMGARLLLCFGATAQKCDDSSAVVAERHWVLRGIWDAAQAQQCFHGGFQSTYVEAYGALLHRKVSDFDGHACSTQRPKASFGS